MPTYVYECSSCNSTYEVEQRITEDALTDCRCGSSGTIKRVIQPVGIAFKGSGFYVNDSASKSSTTPKVEAPASAPEAPAPVAAPAETATKTEK